MRATKQFRLFICGAFGPSSCWALLEARDQSAEGCRRRGQSCAREREALTLQRFLLLGPIAASCSPGSARALICTTEAQVCALSKKVGSFRNCYFNYLPGQALIRNTAFHSLSANLIFFSPWRTRASFCVCGSLSRCGAFQALHSC
jgi:hypothetical protein